MTKSIKGMSDTPPYTSWVNMKASCNAKNHKGFDKAGGLGLGYVAAWSSFSGFWRDMRSTYSVGAKLFRKDYTLAYMKSNCYWKPLNGLGRLLECKRNSSGIKGLSLITDHNGLVFWQYRYTEHIPVHKRISKMFSVSVHGEEKAYYLASLFIRARQGYVK